MNIAILGASGMVGQNMLKILEERNFKVDNLYLFATARSAGKKLQFHGRDIIIEELRPGIFERDINIALFAVEGDVSKEYAPLAAKQSCIVIDNSSYWRMNPDVPLVVPEVNPEALQQHKNIIANPNCTTAQAVVALAPLHKRYGINRVIYTTFQSVSGAGVNGLDDLARTLRGEPHQYFQHPIAGNCIPQIDAFAEDGYTGEEHKMINETKKILNAPQMKLTATTVRIPVEIGHCEAVNLTFDKDFEPDEVRAILADAPGIELRDDPAAGLYPTPREAAGRDPVYVGRIRRDFSAANSLNMWIAADNTRKGAALNAVQIAELL